MKKKTPFIIGVAGGSGSGKTTFARLFQSCLQRNDEPKECPILYQDSYYVDQSSRFDRDGGKVNFDHPDAIDFKMLEQSLIVLRNTGRTEIPQYDFATHKRLKETVSIELRNSERAVVLVDGILIFHPEKLRSLFDYRIFFEAPEELRFQRRLERDVRERGRTPQGVHDQFFAQVKPMHDLYVEPSKQFAHRVVKENEPVEGLMAEVLRLLE